MSDKEGPQPPSKSRFGLAKIWALTAEAFDLAEGVLVVLLAIIGI